jgi:hypothetical protein
MVERMMRPGSMELRITTVFSPLARAAGFFFSEMGVSPTAVALSSFIAALISLFLFLFSFKIPILSLEGALTIAVGLIFVNALLDDIERRVEVRKKKKSIFGGPLGTFLGQLSDAFIILGALGFLSLKDTYYNFGRLWIFNFSYVEPGVFGHFVWGAISVVGILLLRYLASQKKESGTGLWTRSERMYLLSGFGGLGIISGMFSGLLFTGIVALNVLIYISVIRRVFSIKTPSISSGRISNKSKRTVSRGFSSIIHGVKSALRGILRLIGVILLGIYLVLEKIYLAFAKIIGSLLRLKIPKRTHTASVSQRHPPIKPFEGTITPPPSTLPAGSQASDSVSPLDSAETVTEENETVIELPPPTHLMETEAPYTGGSEVGESMIVEYLPTAKKEEVLVDVVDFMMSEGKDIVIVSTQPTTSHYRERYKGLQGIQVIDLLDQTVGLPSKNEIPMTNLEYFSEVFEELTKEHVFIFEPLSNLLLHIGVAQSFRFVSQSLSRLSKMGITLIVFLNSEGHDKKDISNFENLFMNIAEIKDGKLQKVR